MVNIKMKNDFDERYIQKRQKTRQKQAKIGKKTR